METLFQVGNLIVLPFWLLMILLPNWQWTRRILASPWVAAPPALLYALLIVPQLGALVPALANPQIEAVSSLLGTTEGATVAWLHFLAFDLFVGRWIYLEGKRVGITSWLISPLLVLALLVGPLGFLLFLVAQWVWSRRQSGTANLETN